MKKFSVIIVAFCASLLFLLPLFSCTSSKPSSTEVQEITVTGLLQTNDSGSYFIITGAPSKSAKTFFLIKDKKNSGAWKILCERAGKKVSVTGKVVSDSGPWLKTVAVESVSLSE